MPEESATERFRLFIAIAVPGAVKERIQEVQRGLKQAVPSQGLRWTKPEQFHLTLRFLGSVETQQIEPLSAALRAACSRFPLLRLTAKGVGFFPRPSSPRVVWVGLGDQDGHLVQLQKAVADASNAFTAEPPETRFSGHITLARVKGIRRPEADALAQAAQKLSEKELGSWTAREVALVRSQLSPQGARYTVLVGAPLAGG